MSINAQTFTIEEMIKSKMVFFKKNGQVDKRCSAFKQKIVDENCNIILKPAKVVPQLEDVTDSDSDSESCYTVDDDDTASCFTVDDEQQNVDELSDSLSSLMISETVEELEDKKLNVLIGWLIDVQRWSYNYFKSRGNTLNPDQTREILEMTFGIMRRFLQWNKIETDKLQLLAIVAWRMANKLMDDEFYMRNEQCIQLCADPVNDDDIWGMEFKLLNYVSYQVCRDGIDEVKFLERYQGGIEKSKTNEKDIVEMVCVC